MLEPGEARLDPGIRDYVLILREAGIETFESCEGGNDHSFQEPTIRFSGDRGEGFRALALAMQRGFPVSDLSRVWQIVEGEPEGPFWEITFSRSDSN